MTPPFLAAPLDKRPRRAPRKAGGPRRPPRRSLWRRVRRFALRAALVALLVPVPFVILYRFVPPPITPLMIIRSLEGAPLRRHWVPLDRISPALERAVIASEDEKFCFDHGFDWQAIGYALREWRAGRTPNGASTISMQTARNLLLWPDRSYLRKGIEAYITALLALFWSKHRILETYLNIIEWGNGIYGADAAARVYFAKPAAALSPQEAALMAAVLPDPRQWSPTRPTRYIRKRAAIIRARMPAMAIPGRDRCR